MRINFFGTSHGVPEANRRCSSALITLDENHRYFIDMGTCSIENLVTCGISVDSIKAIFLTHMHGDHTNGLIDFLDLCSWYYRSATPSVFFPETDGIEPMKAWLAANGTEMRSDIPLETVHEGVLYDDGILRVTAFRTTHCRTSYAYLLEAGGKRVLFTGDLNGGHLDKDFPMQTAQEQPLDLAVCESAHFPTTAYAPIFKQCKINRVIINHYQTRAIPNIFELANQVAPLPVSIATDGMEVIV
ncbi:MAG: MBL fold metallo-hydrolase [Firmicutes bacterium]|nr:MBL fold metallo-hydrolase [Bacillota bacterium]